MDVVVDFPPARSLEGITFSDLTSAPYLGSELVQTLEFPDTETVSVDVIVLHFGADLTPPEKAAVLRRCRTTPIEESIRTKAASAIAANEAYMALSPPTQAQLVAQVRLQTRELNALLRLVLGLLDTDSDV